MNPKCNEIAHIIASFKNITSTLARFNDEEVLYFAIKSKGKKHHVFS